MIEAQKLREMFEYEPSGTLRRKEITHPNQREYPWWTNDQGYFCGTFGRKNYRLHRLIFLHQHGWLPADIDHINGVRADNRIENLRPCTRSENQFNKGVRKDNASGLKGAFFRKRDAGKPKPWTSKIKVGGMVKSLGYFATAEEAHTAYCAAARELQGDFAVATANHMTDLAGT